MARDLSAFYKETGNRYFASGEYASAEAYYSKAILEDSKNPALYTNRAMARLKQGQHADSVADCRETILLFGDNMKAYYIMAQGLLAMRDFDGALDSARRALDLCETGDKSLTPITALVRECRAMRWEGKEKQRRRQAQELEAELLELMQMEQQKQEHLCNSASDKVAVAAEWQEKAKLLQSLFEKARGSDEKRREVPDWLIDDISFDVMIDPVVTKSGKSYERASIMEALKRQPVDPITREPLCPKDLRPNIDLRKACEQYLEENGWAVDW